MATPNPEQIVIQSWPELFTTLSINADDGSELLAILSDGTVRGTIEHAGPAAQRFVTKLRGLTEAIAAQAKAEALREAAEAYFSMSPDDWKQFHRENPNGGVGGTVAETWLRARAATIEGKSE